MQRHQSGLRRLSRAGVALAVWLGFGSAADAAEATAPLPIVAQPVADAPLVRRAPYNFAPAVIRDGALYHLYWCAGDGGDVTVASAGAGSRRPVPVPPQRRPAPDGVGGLAGRATILAVDPRTVTPRLAGELRLAWREGTSFVAEAGKTTPPRPRCADLDIAVAAAAGASESPLTWDAIDYSAATFSLASVCHP